MSLMINYSPVISGKLKLKGRKTEPSKIKLWRCFFFNLSYTMIFTLSLFSGISFMAPWWFFRKPKLETYSTTLLWTVVYFLTQDIVFYGGHYMFHYTGWKTHNLHHQSWATTAISAYYMTLIDYTAEHLSIFVPFIVWR